MRNLISYQHHTGRLSKPVAFLVVSDLHDEPYDDILPLLKDVDALLAPGDISDRYHQSYARGVNFLRDAAKLRPVFVSLGNHETRQEHYFDMLRAIERSGAELFINRYVRFGEIWLGGWYEPQIVRVPDMLDEFEALDGVKVLLCHKPEVYMRKLRARDIDLTIAGHAHGGQIRFGSQGVYSPGQGLFPRYTRGLYNGGKLIVSAGAGNPSRAPRWGNPCEILKVTLD